MYLYFSFPSNVQHCKNCVRHDLLLVVGRPSPRLPLNSISRVLNTYTSPLRITSNHLFRIHFFHWSQLPPSLLDTHTRAVIISSVPSVLSKPLLHYSSYTLVSYFVFSGRSTLVPPRRSQPFLLSTAQHSDPYVIKTVARLTQSTSWNPFITRKTPDVRNEE